MNRRRIFQLNQNGDALNSTDTTSLRMPALATAAAAITGISIKHVVGPVNKTIITFSSAAVTVGDTAQGVGLKLLDWPAGTFKVRSVVGRLQFTTTSVLADTLNASKTIGWSLGSATLTSSGTLTGTGEADLLGPVKATSGATINVANTVTVGRNLAERILSGPSTAVDTYLNIGVPTATDIDADATVEIDGTITIEHVDLSTTASSATLSNGRMPSASIWADCPWDALAKGELDGHVYWNDFINNYTLANNQTVTNLGDGVDAFTAATGGTTIGQIVTEAPTGILTLACTTINEDCGIMIGGGGNVVGQYVFEAGKKLWFECRVKIVNVTVTKLALLVAFAEEALCATTATLAAGGATIADKDYIGFHKRAADTTAFDIVHNTAGGGGETILAADQGTLAAATFTKLGIYCDGTTIYFYQDGVQLSSVALSAANVPDGQEMALYIVHANAHADDASSAIDWVKIAQQRM